MRDVAPIERVREWLLTANPALSEIGMDTELIDSRIIDSLQFVELVLLIEEIRDAEIPGEEIRHEKFRTLRVIDQALLQERPK